MRTNFGFEEILWVEFDLLVGILKTIQFFILIFFY